LHGRDQREKCALNAIKHTFQANSALLTSKSALLLNKAHIVQALLDYCPRALVQANSPRRTTNHPAGAG